MKNFTRSERNKKIAGVAGGIAEYFNIDPLIVRLVFVITALILGFSIIIYVVLWLLVPIENHKNLKSSSLDSEISNSFEITKEVKSKKKKILAYILIVFGVVILIDNIFPFWQFSKIWPLSLIIIGLYILFKNNSDSNWSSNEN